MRLALSIAIPTVAVIVSMVVDNGRFNSIDGHLSSIEVCLNSIELVLRERGK